MKKIKSFIMFGLCMALLSFALVGCSKGKKETDSDKAGIDAEPTQAVKIRTTSSDD